MYNFYIKDAKILENNKVSIKIQQKEKDGTLRLNLLCNNIDEIPDCLGAIIKDSFNIFRKKSPNSIGGSSSPDTKISKISTMRL